MSEKEYGERRIIIYWLFKGPFFKGRVIKIAL
jgi:hypothetical protein